MPEQSYRLTYQGFTIMNPYRSNRLFYTDVTPDFTRVNFNTSSVAKIQFTSQLSRIYFAVLPKSADTTNLGIAADGVWTESGGGAAVFFVTDYSISSNGDLSVTGYRANNNFNSYSRTTSWPSIPSSYFYYHTSTSVYGNSGEIHKFGTGVQSNAVAVMIAYRWSSSTGSGTLSTLSVPTDRVYKDVRNSCFGVIQGLSFVNEIFNLSAGTVVTKNYSASNILYPNQNSNSIAVGSRTSLGL